MTEQFTGEQFPQAAAAEASQMVDSQPSAMEQQVPVSALQAERAHRQRLEEEIRVTRDNLMFMQARQQAPAQKESDPFEGVSDHDPVTAGELKKIVSAYQGQFKKQIEELSMTTKYSDYQEVVTKYLPEVLKNNPSIVRALESTQDYELAYHLAKNSDGYRKNNTTKAIHKDAARIVENASRPGSISQFGSNSPLEGVKQYKDMSDAEFAREVAKNRGYA